MPLDIIGAGLPRTGTESLKQALEILGFRKCYHMVEAIAHPAHVPQWETAGDDTDWDALFHGYRAAVDFPAMFHWRRLIVRYPQARVVLTVREPEAWYASIAATILTAVKQDPIDDPVTSRRRALVRRDLIGDLFEGRADDRAFMLDLFVRHAATVQAALPAARLLVYDVRQGWQSLCAFLGVAVPARAFPHANARADYRQKFLR